ncbi:MAG TPA: methyltransferase domain-containing protein [Myxococcota bacterium]|nr:methyltransferase domain-containing protein [Myxococcota bacterium]
MIFHFIRQSLRNPNTVGAVLPSGGGLARAMANAALPKGHTPQNVLEVGPGTGPVTQELHSRLQPGDHIEAVELNSEFCKVLRARYPELLLHEKSILDYEPPRPVDTIVSGLPLANFPAELVEAIYKHFFQILRPGGHLIMFQYIGLRHAVRAMAGRESRIRMDRILKLEQSLDPLIIQRIRVPWNVPPAMVTVRRRPDDLALPMR